MGKDVVDGVVVDPMLVGRAVNLHTDLS